MLDADIRAQLPPCRMRELIPIFLEGVYEHMSSNRALVQNAWRGCRSGDEAHSLADVFDPDVVAEAASLQLAGKLFFAGEGPNDAYVLHLKNKATGQKRGRAAESGQGGGRVRGRGHGRGRGRGRESAAALPALAESEPGEATSEEEGNNASWVTDTSCESDSDSDIDSGSGGGSEPSGGRACVAPVPRPAGKRQTTLSSRLAGLGL